MDDIYLDGISIKNKISGLSVSYSEDSVHNSIEFTSIDTNLFAKTDPTIFSGTSRIELRVGVRVLYFLVEERNGGEQSFSVWGRSLSAIHDSPYSADIDYLLETPALASEVAANLVSGDIDWQCADWVLPTTFEFSGTPVYGVQAIAQAIGAVVRSDDAGNLIIRAKYPARPVDMQSSQVAVNYDRSLMLSLDSAESKGPGYNAIEILGKTTDIDLPKLEIEEIEDENGNTIERVQGTDAFIRAYWTGVVPELVETYVTAGIITNLGLNSETIEELITFQDGSASISHPLEDIVSFEWIGDSGSNITSEQYSTELSIENNASRVCRIKYTTSYQRYRLSGHNVEELIAVLSIGGTPDVSVLVKIGVGDRPMNSISDPLLSDDSIAVVRGTAELDDSIYDKKTVTLVAPYNDDAVDGVLAYINDDLIGCMGNFHIKSAGIDFDGPKVTNQLEVVQCRVS